MEIWTVLIPILLTDVVNPVLFAFLVFAASTNRPVLLSSAMLLGHTAAYFGAGVLLALFMERITEYLSTPHTIDFIIELILGAVLVWLAFQARKDPGKRQDEKSPELNVVSAFTFGAVVNFVGIPFAVPYFAAIDQVLKADLTAIQAVYVLLGYNLIYAMPFAIVPVLSAIMGKEAQPLLARVNAGLDRASSVLMPLLLGLLGFALLLDAGSYFIRGASLF
jgi:cytochrome c biogenesis protein CcdA